MNLHTQEFSRRGAIIALLCAALLWSTGGLAIKYVEWHPMAVAGGRSLIAALVLVLICGLPKFSKVALLGAVCYAATVISFVVATKLTTAANAILLQYTAPIWVMLVAPFLLKEPNRLIDWISIIVVFAGMALFFLDDLAPGSMAGNVVAIASGIAFAFTIMMFRLQKHGSPLHSAILGNAIAAIVGLPWILSEPFPGTTSSIAALLYLGIFQLAFSYLLYGPAIKKVTALEGTLIPMLEPLLNPVWVYFLLGEAPGLWALVGGVLVLLGVSLKGVVELRSRERERLEPA